MVIIIDKFEFIQDNNVVEPVGFKTTRELIPTRNLTKVYLKLIFMYHKELAEFSKKYWDTGSILKIKFMNKTLDIHITNIISNIFIMDFKYSVDIEGIVKMDPKNRVQLII